MKKISPKNLQNFGKFTYNKYLIDLLKTGRYVYFITTEKPIWYSRGKSRIVYIGQSEKNPTEALTSLARVLIVHMPGLKRRRTGNSLTVYFIPVGENISARELEHAFIAVFSMLYGTAPIFNKEGKGFAREKVERIQDKLRASWEVLIEIVKLLEKEEEKALETDTKIAESSEHESN